MQYILDTAVYLLDGTKTTVLLYIATAIFALPISIILATFEANGRKPIKKLLHIYAWIFRGTPLILQLIFFYFGISIISNYHIVLSPFQAAVITFVLNYSAYLMEIFRSGIESIDKGQYEAASALNFSRFQTMRRIILPQAIRRVLPPLSNEAINLVKDTALVIVIGMGDLMRAAKEILTRDFTLIPFVVAAIIYLFLTSLIVLGFRKLEKKYVIRS